MLFLGQFHTAVVYHNEESLKRCEEDTDRSEESKNEMILGFLFSHIFRVLSVAQPMDVTRETGNMRL